MARSSADDMELKRACEAGILSKEKAPEKVVLSMRVAKGRVGPPRGLGIAGKLTSRHNMAKPRVLAVTTKAKGQKTKAFLRVLKYSNGGILEGFDNLKSQSISPPQWTLRNKDDRNRLLMCILNLCKELLGGIPKVVGMDIVEMAIWAKENTTTKVTQVSTKDGPIESVFAEAESEVTVEKDLVSQAEEEDIEALLGTYVMAIGEAEAFSERMKRELVALESANVYALMETESVVEEVREKRAEFVLLKCTFVRRAAEFLRNYFPSLIDSMLNDKGNFSQAREFSNELRTSSKASKSSTPLFEGPAGANQPAGITDSSADAYSKMITVFIPLLVDESSFLAHFMCFDVALDASDSEENSSSPRTSKASASSVKPRQFVDDACYQIEKYERNVRQVGVVPYIPRFSQLAARMEQYINGSRDLVDQAYTKIIPFQVGMSKVDFRKMLKSSLTGVCKE
ncbi:hypothetical protein ACQ4PT_018925 [Festuca glaucescens]